MTITFSKYVQAAERARAQQEFNLGLRNLHAFSPFESLRHFSRCAEVCYIFLLAVSHFQTLST